ncbi:MAG: MFS transporter [Bacillota bacterium]
MNNTIADIKKLDIKKTILIGCGFLAISLAWAMYNAYVPLILDTFLSKTILIGLIMSIDNIFAVILQPVIGELSDNTRTRFGKRMPYVLIAMPLCAILFALIPLSPNLFTLMLVVIFFNLIMSAWRTPVIALMPDMVPRNLRSQANGLINLMGGIGSILALFIGGMLLFAGGMKWPFLFGAIAMGFIWLIFFIFLKEPPIKADGTTLWQRVKVSRQKEKAAAKKAQKMQQKIHNKNLLFLLLAVFFVFAGINSLETYFTLYATKTLGAEAGEASFALSYFALTFMAGAFPAGIIGGRWGRNKAILLGIASCTILFCLALFTYSLTIIKILMLAAGFLWALVNTNILPLVLDLSASEHLGRYTGYYYFFASAASIASPALFGFIHDIFHNYNLLFVYAAVTFALAIIFLSLITIVKKATPKPLQQNSTS